MWEVSKLIGARQRDTSGGQRMVIREDMIDSLESPLALDFA